MLKWISFVVMKSIAIILVIFCAAVGCHSSKNTETANQITKQDSAIILSFFSRGTGIDYKAYEVLADSMEAYTAQYGDSLVHTSTRWGREGEVDVCFPPQATSYYSDFCDFLARTFSDHPNVHYTKAVDCGKGGE